ncbi:unnamed protein product [Polarella glacialis]|uniref:Uncharacterized protein n=1 Tax=Polarella glacialis TaxID=89957 RepID=A0A813J0X3_POLGL|nr:unnamed protein product [Polarella glacialis]
MIFAAKKEPRDGGGLFAAVVRAIHDQLSIKADQLHQAGVLNYRADTYQFQVPSYPGLASAYRTHYVQVDVLESGVAVFSRCGLQGFGGFTTTHQYNIGQNTTSFWRWYDAASALKEGLVKFPSSVTSHPKPSPDALPQVMVTGDEKLSDSIRGLRALTTKDLPNTRSLEQLFQKAGIDPARYGNGNAKSMEQLLQELESADSKLEWCEETATLRRVVELVFIQFIWNGRVLVEQEQIFFDGRIRRRNMLVADKRGPCDPDVASAAVRGLREELDWPYTFPDLAVLTRFMPEGYCQLIEKVESTSYPGLLCTWLTHFCSIQLLEAGVEFFEGPGMLRDSFETVEKDKTNR